MSAAALCAHRPGIRVPVITRYLMLLCLAGSDAAHGIDPAPVNDAGLRYSWQTGLAYSDNRLRQHNDPERDLYLDALFGFTLQGATPKLHWRGSGQLQGSQSLQDGPNEPPRAELALALDWTLIEQRLAWHFAQLASIEQIDPLQSDSADNRQQTRISVSGPSLLFGAPATWLARLDARLALARAEHAPDFDHRRENVAVSVQRRSTPVLKWTLLAEHSDIRFRRNGEANDFIRDDLLLSTDYRLPRGALSLTLGRTWIDRRSGGRLQRPLWQAELTLAAATDSQLQLRYADALTDVGRDLSLIDDPAERMWQESRRGRVDGSLYRLRNLDISWRQNGARLAGSVAGFSRQVDYIDANAIGESGGHGLRCDLSYRLSPRWTLHAEAAAARYRFAGLPRQDHDRSLGIGAEHQLTPRWSLRLDGNRFLRDSNQPFASYAENLLSLFLTYRSDS